MKYILSFFLFCLPFYVAPSFGSSPFGTYIDPEDFKLQTQYLKGRLAWNGIRTEIKEVSYSDCVDVLVAVAYYYKENRLIHICRKYKNQYLWWPEHIMVHEIGHSLGLPHSSQVDTVMYSACSSGCSSAWFRSSPSHRDWELLTLSHD